MKRINFEVAADAPLEERLDAKRAELANYEEILPRWQSSRWYDSGRRHLAELKVQLKALEDEEAAIKLQQS